MFSLAETAHVRLSVMDLRGRRVATLFRGELPAGSLQSFEWKGLDERGTPVSSGVYFARLASPEGQLTRKMMLLK